MRFCLLPILLCLSLPLSALTVYAESSRLIAAGNKQQAWALLYPLARDEGDSRSMMLLGQMLLNSPEIDDNSNKALRMFRAAANKGHPGAADLVEVARSQMEFSREAERRVANARTYYSQAERDFAKLQKRLQDGFLDDDGSLYDAQVDVFIDGDSPVPSQVERLISSRLELRSSVLTRYHLVFDKSQIGRANPFSPAFSPPTKGLEPDINGKMARKLGVSRFPAIVLRTSSSKTPKPVSLNQLTTWANQWSKK